MSLHTIMHAHVRACQQSVRMMAWHRAIPIHRHPLTPTLQTAASRPLTATLHTRCSPLLNESTATTPINPPPPSAAAPASATSASSTAAPRSTRDLSPSELVKELDRFIVGQNDAKKAVAIALRNRWRRHRLPADWRADVTPKNLLLIGPTGCGKTEIARRLARLTDSPFIKVEATKFTEVGFHGRDVDSIIQDLVRVAIQGQKAKRKAEAKAAIQERVTDRLLEALAGSIDRTDTFRASLLAGELEHIEVEVEVAIRAPEEDDSKGRQMTPAKLQSLMAAARGQRSERRKLKIRDARPLLEEMEMDLLVSPEEVTRDALKAVAEDGIVFIDEIDKIATAAGAGGRGADASAEGVQRDLLPLIEGTTVSTNQGDVNTEHILFICSGAFHAVKPADLLAELQGRLPIRVELAALTEEDLYRVLSQTENSLVQQQVALLEVDNCKLVWKDEALKEIAKVSAEVNRSVDNIGARRLNTVIEKIVDDISYNAADSPDADGKVVEHVIDAAVVRTKVADLLKTNDLGKFLL